MKTSLLRHSPEMYLLFSGSVEQINCLVLTLEPGSIQLNGSVNHGNHSKSRAITVCYMIRYVMCKYKDETVIRIKHTIRLYRDYWDLSFKILMNIYHYSTPLGVALSIFNTMLTNPLTRHAPLRFSFSQALDLIVWLVLTSLFKHLRSYQEGACL